MGVVHTAVHNGTSVSVAHNLRLRYITDKEEHIDPNGEHETWHHEDIKQAYEDLFGDAIREYNSRQKRKDRLLDENYIKTIQEDPCKHVVYEFIVGVYPQDADACPDWLQKAILKEYADEFVRNNPNLHATGIYYHADEPGAGLHLHITYVPIGHFNAYGAKVQNSLSRALKEQGLVLKKTNQETGEHWRTAQMQLQDRERDRLDAICREHGLEVEHPVIEGKAEAREHLETEHYKAEQRLETTIDHYNAMEQLADEQMRRADLEEQRAQKAVKLREQAKELKDEIKALKGDYDEQVGVQVKTAGKTLLGRPKRKIELDYTEYQALTARANAVTDLQTGQQALQRDRRDVEELRQKVFREKADAERKMKEAVQRHVSLEAQERDFNGIVERKVEEILTTERTATEKAMRAYMKGFNVNGRNMLEIFDEQEKQRRLERQHSRGLER